ncbi:alcohol dehydrogenase catalytic domain-containing protein [Synergistales bacterium]|nr:alcohol dehydrogenase catalytic domain-containing protein [Synergistales bacterium]
MKALMKYATGPGNMEIRDIPEPTPGPGQVKIEVKEAGICGSDIHIYHSDIAIPLNPPVVTGHEFSGVVVENGEGSKRFKPGDRVVSETAFHYCGVCDFCREGFYNLCVERRTLGYWFNGVFTRYTVVPEARVHAIPEGVDFTSAAMTEPLACVVHAIYDLTRIVASDVVLVSGPGSVGLMAAQIAKAHGATVVVSGTDVDKDRLEMAKKLGADHTINVQKENLTEFLNGLTRGYGADVVLECSGSPFGTDAGLNAIKKRGWFTQIGLPGKKIEFDIEKVCYKELHFSGSLGSRNASWRKALELLGAGKVNVKPLVSDKLSILEWERAFKKFESKEGGKIFLLPVLE